MDKKDQNTSNKPGLKVKVGLSAGEGLGDKVCHVATVTGIKSLFEWYDGVTGNEGGCEKRKQTLNEWIPNMPW